MAEKYQLDIVDEESKFTSLIQQLSAISMSQQISPEESLDVKRKAIDEKYRQVDRLKGFADLLEKRIDKLESLAGQRISQKETAQSTGDEGAAEQLEEEIEHLKSNIQRKRVQHSEVLDALEAYSMETRQLEVSIISDLDTSTTDSEYLDKLTANVGHLQQDIEDVNKTLNNLHDDHMQQIRLIDALEEEFDHVEEQLIQLAQEQRVI